MKTFKEMLLEMTTLEKLNQVRKSGSSLNPDLPKIKEKFALAVFQKMWKDNVGFNVASVRVLKDHPDFEHLGKKSMGEIKYKFEKSIIDTLKKEKW